MAIFAISATAGFYLVKALRGHGRLIQKVILAIIGIAICGGVIFALTLTFNTGLGLPTAIAGLICGTFIKIGSSFSGGGEPPTTFGSSRWASTEDLRDNKNYGTEGIRIGQASNESNALEWVSYKGDRHLLTVAPTRAGKGTTQIIPNLLTYEGSVLVIDPKGENAKMSAERRKDMGQDVHIVDPWGIAQMEGIQSSTFNPIDWLDVRDPDCAENAMLLASAIVVEGNSKDPFWDEEAKALLHGLIMHVATDPEEDGQRHLGRVRDILILGRKELDEQFERMACSMHPIVRSTGERSLQKEEKMFASVLATVQSHTHFLDSDRMRANLASSSFKFEDLKTNPMTIYLVLPADRLNTFGRWLRLLVQQSITVNARNIETKPDKPILFILDEFAALGRLTMVEQAYGLMAGFGMQLWGIVQDLNQLQRIYGEGWQSFIANAGMINYFGSSDKMTTEYFSSMCGETTVWNISSALSRAFGTSSGQGGSSASETMTDSDTTAASQRKLMYPDELMRLPRDMQLVFMDNMHPLRAKKVTWFLDLELKELGRNLQD
jgi:type IV secretion system protein VirD4